MTLPPKIPNSSFIGGLTVIRRINWPVEYAKVPSRKPSIDMSDEEVFEHYKGIDGEAWPETSALRDITLQAGLAPLHEYEAVKAYLRSVSAKYKCDLLYLEFPCGADDVPPIPLDFKFLGYDYGFYQSEDNLFSSIFHEVIYGRYGEMKSHASFLNNNLLLPTLETISSLTFARDNLLKTGADLETDDEAFMSIAIYGKE